MEKLNLQIEKYSFIYDNNDTYFVYSIQSTQDKAYTDFYIQKENYGFISFCISLNMKEIDSTNEEFINENIMEWIDLYEDDIEVLEDEKRLNM